MTPALRTLSRIGIASTLGLCLVCPAPLAAGQTAPTDKAASKALYERLGGVEAIRAVVDDFLARVGADDRINKHFAGSDLDGLKKHLTDQICQAAGGPCTYTGRDMKTVHAGMDISGGDFNALVQDLVASLEKFKVSKADSGALVGLLAPMKKDIVEKP